MAVPTFFEIEHEDSLTQYGPSKEHRSNCIVKFGFFKLY